MSFSIDGKKCKCCNGYLFEEDDVVFCPVCGAPHHRDCYNSLGHCALEELHGTDKQYDSSKDQPKKEQETAKEEVTPEKTPSADETKCQMCGETYDMSENSCPKCGTANTQKFGGRYIMFDFLGGVPADYDLGDNVTADEAKRFVAANTNKYIPKFAGMKNGKKASLNILALLFPAPWLLSRKMYGLGALVAAVEIALKTLLFPFVSSVMNSVPEENISNYQSMMQYFADNYNSFNTKLMIVAEVAVLLLIALHIIFGIFGDKLFRNHAISKIKEIKETSEDKDADFRKYGGVSFALLLIGFFATQYLPEIIASFAGII